MAADTSTPGVVNSYTSTGSKQPDLQALPQLPNLTGTNTFINWIDQSGFAAGYGTVADLFTIGNLGGGFGSAFNVNEDGHMVGISSLPGDQTSHDFAEACYGDNQVWEPFSAIQWPVNVPSICSIACVAAELRPDAACVN